MAARVCAWRARSDLQPPLTLPLFSVSQSTVAGSMPSKYGKQYAVPKEFPSVLKSFTREVLRAQPSDIYEFGAQYFSELLAQAEAAAAAENAGVRRLSPEELEQLLTQMFHEADVDGSGALSMSEFREVLKMADLGLSDRETKRVMAEADFDGNGEISYAEFIPLAVDLVQSMYAKMEMEAAKAKEEDEAREEAKNYLLHGMTKEEVESVMIDIFHKSDADGSGALSLQEFQKCCRDADIGLTRKEVNILMHQCDVDGDGHISYEEFVPLCFEMLTEILKDELLQEKRTPTELETFLVQIFSEADIDGAGALSPLAMKEVIKSADFGLTRLQIHSVLAEAEYDEDGLADYRKFSAKAAEMIYRLLDMDTQIERAEAIQNLTASGQDFSTVHGYSQGDVEAVITQELQGADAAGSGVLHMSDVQKCLKSSALQLSPVEINALMSACEVDPSGMCQYMTLASYAFYILQYIAQEAAYGGM